MNKQLTTFNTLPALDIINKNIIGIDNIFDKIFDYDFNKNISYPPHNIIKKDNKYIIEVAVAGFNEDELDIYTKEQKLYIKGYKKINTDENCDSENCCNDEIYIHRGIAKRNFDLSIQLAENIEVETAKLENGLLSIELIKNIPEKLKYKKITIEK